MSIPILYGPCFQPIGTDQGEKRKLFSDLWACWPQRRCWLQWRSKDWWMLEAVCNGSTVPDTIWLILPLHEKEKKQNKTQQKTKNTVSNVLRCSARLSFRVWWTPSPCVFFLGYMGGDFLLLNSDSPAPRTARCTSTRGRHWQKPAVRYLRY